METPVKMFLFYNKNNVYRDLISILGGFLRGINYGIKIRLPHAFVMTFLFRPHGTIKDKLEWIIKATKQHAWNLSRFVFIYKFIMTLLLRLRIGESKTQIKDEKYEILNSKQPSWHSFIAGSIGGYLIFSKDNNINNQIVLYLLARVITSLEKLLYKREKINFNSFPYQATLVWGLIMWIWHHDDSLLQPSLQSSMKYLYKENADIPITDTNENIIKHENNSKN